MAACPRGRRTASSNMVFRIRPWQIARTRAYTHTHIHIHIYILYIIYIYIYTHTHIYIYIYIFFCFFGGTGKQPSAEIDLTRGLCCNCHKHLMTEVASSGREACRCTGFVGTKHAPYSALRSPLRAALKVLASLRQESIQATRGLRSPWRANSANVHCREADVASFSSAVGVCGRCGSTLHKE